MTVIIVTYQHKKNECSKDTKEIVENIVRFNKAYYELDVKSKKFMESLSQESAPPLAMVRGKSKENIFAVPSNLAKQDFRVEGYKTLNDISQSFGNYQEISEKKRNRRNYIEFKIDYENL